AAGHAPQMIEAWHRVDSLLDGLGDGDQHLIDGKNAVVDAHHDAREIRLREHRDRNGERQIGAHGDQGEDDDDDGLAVAGRPVRRVGLSGGVAHWDFGLASPFFWSLPAAGSDGAFSSSSSAASFTLVSMTLTLALSSRPM